MRKPITTQSLFNLVLLNPQKMFEVRLLLKRSLVATHFIYFNGKSFYDEGIDGEKRRVGRDEFFKNYKNSYWLVDNMI